MEPIKIPDGIKDLAMEIWELAHSARNPKTNKVIVFKGNSGFVYTYFTKDWKEYCYTTRPCIEGWFYSWIYVPLGAGARSGKAKRWAMKNLQCHRKRKDAKSRALRMKNKPIGKDNKENADKKIQ